MIEPKPKRGDVVVTAPTAAALLPRPIRNKIEKACKIKAQIDALNAELADTKEELIAVLKEHGRTRESCAFGVVQLYNGKESTTPSEWAKGQMKQFENDLRHANPTDFTTKVGAPYLTVSATVSADTSTVS